MLHPGKVTIMRRKKPPIRYTQRGKDLAELIIISMAGAAISVVLVWCYEIGSRR